MKNIKIGDPVEISPSVTGKEDWDWTRATVVEKGYTGELFEWVIDVRTDDGVFYSITWADDTKIKKLNEFTLKLPCAVAEQLRTVFELNAIDDKLLFGKVELVSITEEDIIGENMALVRLSSYAPITPDDLFWLGHQAATLHDIFKPNERTKKKLHRKA